jgi:hypothetical protein
MDNLTKSYSEIKRGMYFRILITPMYGGLMEPNDYMHMTSIAFLSSYIAGVEEILLQR